jgi:hypothetical protein
MRKISLYIFSGTLIFLVNSRIAFSQNPVSVKASVNRKKILIGEPIQLTLEAKVPANADINWFPEDSIPHFEFIQKGKIDSLTSGDEKSYRQDILVTSFDSGTQVIPGLSLSVNGTAYVTDSTSIEVGFTKFNPEKDYHDIKDIIDPENPDAKYIPWALAALTLLSAVLVAYYVQKKRKTKEMAVQQAIAALSPYDEAIRALEELRKQDLPANGQVKLFYTRLNDILRLFILRKLEIASLVKTNNELILQLKSLDISAGQFSQLAQSLRMSDFVKFAKYLPDEKDNEQNFIIIKSSVELLNTIEK